MNMWKAQRYVEIIVEYAKKIQVYRRHQRECASRENITRQYSHCVGDACIIFTGKEGGIIFRSER